MNYIIFRDVPVVFGIRSLLLRVGGLCSLLDESSHDAALAISAKSAAPSALSSELMIALCIDCPMLSAIWVGLFEADSPDEVEILLLLCEVVVIESLSVL